MPNEPHVSYPFIAFVAGMIILLFGKMNFVLRGAMLVLCGFLYAVCYTQNFVSTPILKYSVRDKIITAQIKDIEKLKQYDMIDLLDEKIQELIEYRLKYPEVSLLELSEIISMETGNKITKSGLYHRFNKIKLLAKKIRENNQNN